MLELPPSPLIYEINTWPWLAEVGVDDLAGVPDHRWDAIARGGYDAVWLMGVWRRSPVGVSMALQNDGLVDSFRAALPDYRPDDVVGSPYCVRDYVVDDCLGGRGGLAAARAALAERGVAVVLDFVPNHVAPDHPWVTDHPDRFVRGSVDDLRDDPSQWVEIGGVVFANGKDPFFPAWPDVVQLNAFSRELREAVTETLHDIAEQCDAVRCDMAMLVMNDVFGRTWASGVGATPEDDYWPTIIAAVRRSHPGFRFLAEAYWDLEWSLQEQGFDHCYDKQLYDRLLGDDPETVRLHLCADLAYQQRLLRFVENHDEPRIAAEVDRDRQKALTVATLTQMGARLVHHGQDEGRTVRLPVFLGRFPSEPVDADLVEFHAALLHALRDPTFRDGRWHLCERWGFAGDDRAGSLVAWSWTGSARWLVVVNLADQAGIGAVRAPWEELRGVECRLVDPVNGRTFERSGDQLRDGLYVELDPWAWHLFRIET